MTGQTAEVTCRLNGVETTLRGSSMASPASTSLRDHRVFSVRETCGVGVCGTCTVRVDGVPVSTCILPLYALAGKNVSTAEGLDADGMLSDVQKAFIATQAFQCSFCTPGFVMSAHALLDGASSPLVEKDLHEGLSGHLCRCGCYASVLEAVRICGRARGLLDDGERDS